MVDAKILSRNEGDSVRTGTAIHSKGQKRVDEIMEAAKAVLVEKGYIQFSLRNIAAQAGMHLSNLQYYFPTKDKLIEQLMSHTANQYFTRYRELFESLPSMPYPRFIAVLDYLLADIRNPRTRRFFIQLWALLDALGPHSDRLLNELYSLHIDELGKSIRKLNPSLSDGARRQRAAMIAAMIEGMMLMLEDADADLAEGEPGIEMEMRKQLVRIATD